MNLAIIEDHTIVRKGLMEIIQNFGEFRFVIEAENGIDFIEKIKCAKIKPTICIIDVNMPKMDGFQLVKYIRDNYPELKILILTTFDEEYFLIKMIKLKVNGYLLKNCSPDELKNALITISKDSNYYNNSFSKKLKNMVESNFVKLPSITENESNFLEFCVEDLTYSQIGDKLNKSQRSIEGYRDSLFRKFEVNNRASLVLVAIRLGIIKL